VAEQPPDRRGQPIACGALTIRYRAQPLNP
jgi:hypothetical protein